MAIKPILFSGPMVRALLEGRKTQTRRIAAVKKGLTIDDLEWVVMPDGLTRRAEFRRDQIADPQYAVGDLLYVREAWRTLHAQDCLAPRHLAEGRSKITYEADPQNRNPLWAFGKLRPGMHMPRWASRITLEVTEVRVQRLQEISRGDAMEEGCPFANMAEGPDPRDWFRDLWDSLNAERAPWSSNPWVAAYTFKPHLINVDQPARDLGLLPSTPEAK